MFWLFFLSACAVAGISCTRLCRAAVRAAAAEGAPIPRGHRLTVYEAAFLSGGPYRVADVAMVSMARQRRLLLAHTGWATVIDPRGRDALERSVLGAIGPDGQSRIGTVREAAAVGDPVRVLADRLVAAGLAVPESARGTVAEAVRKVRAALFAVLVLGALALSTAPRGSGGDEPAWFALPLLLIVSCLLIARVEAYPYTRWASASGHRLLGGLSSRSAGDDRTYLTAVALGGVTAVDDPDLEAAFARPDRRGDREDVPGARRDGRDGPDRGAAKRER
ncbi:TIGR04222 domain-containing membrane protein [Streptomyces uncialis]|uniref:TIGR04222 domain-containing membrane protein n=1 Tax=Streptomyces uncialis TaxID=1048205 RepID=UPI0038680413|nr:TIGR04222 domain-containing membrane protein [Streptomyces uncialis]